MEDQELKKLKKEQIATEAGYILRHFLDGFSRYAPNDDLINDQIFNEAIDQIKNRNYLEEYDDLKKNNKAMKVYLEALLKTIKTRINLFDPEIQNEIKRNSEEILALEDAPIFEVKKQEPEEEKKERPRFKGWNEEKLDAL